MSDAKPVVSAAVASANAAPVRPITIDSRSPMRSLTMPQGRSVSVMPMFVAARTTPICARLRP